MRKTFNYLFVLTALLSLSLLSSCSDDDALPKKITIDGEKFSLSHGYIQGVGSGLDDNDDLVSLYMIVLSTEGLTVVDGGPVGSGAYIMMRLVSPTSISLANGTYQISNGESFLKQTAISFAAKNFNADVPESGDEYDALSGTIKISRSGSTYKITFNVIMEDEEENEVEVKGSYEGKLPDTFISGNNN